MELGKFTVRKKWFRALFSIVIALLLGVDVQAQGQTNVSGVVTGPDGNPVAGATVNLEGTEQAVSTDGSGRFVLNNLPSGASLVFKALGYETTTIAVAGRSVVNAQLKPSEEALDEVVVTALGIKRETKSLGYSVGQVDGEDMVNVPQENVINSLAGRVPGVTINQTGGPGSSVSMVIRGATSLSNDNQPLFVVDGVPMQNTLNNASSSRGDRNDVDYGNVISDINPENIESVSILKGPSAAALYGSRAGNGVVLITTKAGKKSDGLGIHFSTSNVFEVPYRYLDYHYKYGNGNMSGGGDTYSEGSAYWGGAQLDVGIKAPHFMSPLDENGNKIPIELKSYPDNLKNFMETGITSVNNLAVAGSNALGTYRISYDMMRHNGMIPNADLNRDALAAVAEFQIRHDLRVSTNLNFLRSSSPNRPATGRGSNPLMAAYNWPAIDINDMQDYWQDGAEHVAQRRPAEGMDNPYFLAYGLTNAYTRDHAYGNVRADWTIAPGLSMFGRVSHDIFNEAQETKIPWSYSRMNKGGYFLDDFVNQETNMDVLATYQKVINGFDIAISGGANSMFRQHKIQSMGGVELSVPGLYRISNIPTSNRSTWNNTYMKRIYSILGTASIGYKEKIYLDLTARNDWSSTLPVENRSYFYPSASLSWLASNTFKMPEQISLLKFRGGVAQVGNDTNPYELYNALGIGSWGDLVTNNIQDVLKNPQLKPEIASSYEGGIDLWLFNNRVKFEGTYFYVENKNQILNVNTAPSSGFVAAKINAGMLSSRGLELALITNPIRDRNGWNLDVNLNWSRTRTTLDALTGDLQYHQFWSDNDGGAYSWVGEEIGNLYSSGYLQVTDPNDKYYRWPILDSNGEWQEDNAITAMEKVGNWNPDFLMGGQLSLRYKRFNLTTSFDWRAGGQFMSWTYRYGESDWKSQRQLDMLIPGSKYTSSELAEMLRSNPEKYIIPQNGNFPRVGGHTQEAGGYQLPDGLWDGGFIPGVIQQDDGSYVEHLGEAGTNLLRITDMFPWGYNKQVTFDSDFFKIREISLGYSIPKVGGLRNVHVSVYTRNLIIWTKAKIGIDPERAFRVSGDGFRQGIEWNNVLPWTMPIGFKLNVSL
ncbi:SusC/RagA family TonB-linked outer membrane protein [Parapedobacter sp. 10938]|uniref:SusC/RagA family TonB-linked outer membrane protein n=1 Tax=Parapedobacter flavus TaxID=3110225 RepID=UPI002DB6F1D6|nr:SusC/RagA family TonB-linked outer membrane protein [Parapedobacter sp. 10938]MEC3881974.1 SusC/RagA family TonB-linked outer membrane protein [Parapedobacter sp. 10938]